MIALFPCPSPPVIHDILIYWIRSFHSICLKVMSHSSINLKVKSLKANSTCESDSSCKGWTSCCEFSVLCLVTWCLKTYVHAFFLNSSQWTHYSFCCSYTYSSWTRSPWGHLWLEKSGLVPGTDPSLLTCLKSPTATIRCCHNWVSFSSRGDFIFFKNYIRTPCSGRWLDAFFIYLFIYFAFRVFS